MEWFKRSLKVAALLALGNVLLLFGVALNMPLGVTLACIAGLTVFYIWFHIRPCRARAEALRLRTLRGGYEILLCAFCAIVCETALYLWLALSGVLSARLDGVAVWIPLLINALVFVPLIAALLVNGFFRVLLTSARLRIVWRVLLLTCWWVPVLNLFIFYHALKGARAEYTFALARQELDEVHAENEDCKTRYPLVLVHGIFFRDWQHINYWGRVPQALAACGATIFYGNQQSAAPVARSAEELAARLQAVLDETGASKVNIIAHSKGGLDSRYAITRLGMAAHVASLTTVNTPHRGCVFAQHVLKTLPKRVLRTMETRYNGLFHKLGDANPDFLGGVRDLTDERCKQFNRETPDAEGVCYRSVMTTMKSPKSAGFPLSMTWKLVNKYDKERNDGLVALTSAQWGEFLGETTVPGTRGISHGDAIDLLREDIAGFDVREFYIELVRGLKAKGL